MYKVLQLKRNATLFTSKSEALSALSTQLTNAADGELILARYTDNGEAKSVFGVKAMNGDYTSSTIYDSEAIPADVQAKLDVIQGDDTVDGSILKALKDAKAYTDEVITAVNDTIDEQVEALEAKITSSNAGATTEVVKSSGASHITVEESSNTDDGHKIYTIGETNVASADDLTTEISNREAADSAINDKIGTSTDVSSAGTVYAAIKKESEDRAAAISSEESARNTAISNAINALDKAEVGGSGKYIKSVSETDGVITAVADDLKAANVAATATTGSTSAVAVTGTTVAAQIESLATSIKTVEGNAAKYEVVKLSDAEISSLNDANVKEAYKVVSYVGDSSTATKTQVGETIKIYKDASLQKVELDADGQGLKFTYNKADGTTEVVTVDFKSIAFNAEFKNGLEVSASGEISVKKDSTSEDFLSVSANGIKIDGVQTAINTAQAAATTVVSNKTDGHVKVSNTTQDDGHSVVTITETDIASASDLATETTNRTDADKAITDSIGTSTDTKDKSTVYGAIAKEASDRADAISTEVTNRNTAITNAVNALDAEKTSTDGANVQVKVTEVDGKITAVNITTDNTAKAGDLTNEVSRAKAAEDKIEASVGLAEDGSHKTTSGNYTSAATTVVGEIAALDTQVKANADAIATLNGADTVSGSVAKSVKDAKATIDAYTVNGKAISVNPVLSGADVKATGYAKASSSEAVDATDTVNVAIGKLEYKLDSVIADALVKVLAGAGISVTEKASGKQTVAVKVKDGDPILEATENGLAVKDGAVFDLGTY